MDSTTEVKDVFASARKWDEVTNPQDGQYADLFKNYSLKNSDLAFHLHFEVQVLLNEVVNASHHPPVSDYHSNAISDAYFDKNCVFKALKMVEHGAFTSGLP